MKVRYINMIATVFMAVSVLSGCAKTGAEGDSGQPVRKEAAVPASYDAQRARKLLDKYSAGMLSDEDYTVMLDLVTAFYDYDFRGSFALLEQAESKDEFDRAFQERKKDLAVDYPYATDLPQVLGEAVVSDPVISERNKKRWKEIDARFAKMYKDFTDSYKRKFGLQ